MKTCYLSLGSNLGNRSKNLDAACQLLENNNISVVESSSIYESEAWGYADSKKYYNQVVCVRTSLLPESLLEQCQKIEHSLGRIRSGKGYEARTVDIDILFYDYLVINMKDLKIPHEHMHKRLFVLKPLAEIAPDFVHPVLKFTVNELLKQCSDDSWINVVSE